MKLIIICVFFSMLYSCQENNEADATNLAKEKEELLKEKEALLEEKAKMIEESKAALEAKERTVETEKNKTSSASNNLTDMRGNPCITGEWYFAQINDKDGYTNIRKSPSSNSDIISQVNEGEEFKVLITKEKWLRAIAPDGTQGYIRSKLVSPVYMVQ
jgi:uncharacterized protein YgiM (DUF1202 family)